MNPKVGLYVAGGCAVAALTRLGHNPFLHNSNMKAFWAFAAIAVVIGAISLIASAATPQTRSR